MGKSTINHPFSIAMLNYQRVQFTAAESLGLRWFLWIHPALVLVMNPSTFLSEWVVLKTIY